MREVNARGTQSRKAYGGEERGRAKRAELETEAVRAVSWLLVAQEVWCGCMCVVLAKPSSCFSHCWVDT